MGKTRKRKLSKRPLTRLTNKNLKKKGRNRNYEINRAYIITLQILSVFLILSLFSFQSTITGFIVAEKQFNYSESINKGFNESSEFIWIPENNGKLKSLSISGSFAKDGDIKVYLEDADVRYLVFDNNRGDQNSIASITGSVISDENNDLVINETTNLIPTLNNKTENKTTSDESISKKIDIGLDYGNNEFFDEDNDGVEDIDNVIDLTVENSSFNWEVDKSNLCTRWGTYSVEAEESTIVCYGSNRCCQFVDLLATRPRWNETFYSAYGTYGATYNNVISAQVLYVDYNLSSANPYADVHSSDWENLSANYFSPTTSFDNICIETCSLSLNKSSYKMIIEVNNSALNLNAISYIIEKESKANVAEIIDKREETLNKTRVVINSPVKWVKKVKLDDAKSNVAINITSDATNITVKRIDNNVIEEIPQENIKIKDKGEIKDLKEYEDGIKDLKKEKSANLITGNVILEDNLIGDNSTEIIIEDEIEEVEIEYYTEGPTSEEINITENKKKIVISSNIHYEDILAFTILPKEVSLGTAKLFWIVNDTRINVDIDEYDTNENNLVDYIEWIVPSLSNQTYELIIEITKAEHLDKNRLFVEDIFDLVKARDNVWTKEILVENYIRVTFEQKLTSDKDITIYARSNYSNATVEVYEKDKNNLLATFENINEDKKYQILLTNLIGSQDTFDLKIKNNPIEFDYIVDPKLVTESSESDDWLEWMKFKRFLNGTSYTNSFTPDDITNTDVKTFATGNNVWRSGVVSNGSLYWGNTDETIFHLNATNISKHISNVSLVGDPFMTPAVANGFVYAGVDSGSKIYQLNASNVSHIYATYTASTGFIRSNPAVYDGSVYISSDNAVRLFQLNASNVSKLISQFNTGSRCSTGPAIANGYVYLTCNNGRLYQLNATDVSDEIANFNTGVSFIFSSPAVANGYVYFGGDSNKLYQVNASDVSKEIASYTTGADIDSSPAVANGYVYVGSDDKKVYQLNASNVSNLIATYTTGNVVRSSPAVNEDYVFVGSSDSKFYQLDASNVSKLIASYSVSASIQGAPIIAGGYVYVGVLDSSNGYIYQFGNENPYVKLLKPDNGHAISGLSSDVQFNCSAMDRVGLENMSLYITNPNNQSFSLNQTTNISSRNNQTNFTISLSEGNYSWNCLAYDVDGNIDWGKNNRSVIVDPVAPIANINLPVSNYYNDTSDPFELKFNCSATDNVNLKNVSLYLTNRTNGSLSLNQSSSISGTNDDAAWTLSLNNGNYTWGCLAYDAAGNSDWGNANRTILINYTDVFIPEANTSLNKSLTNIRIKDVINISANVTDDHQLSHGQIIVNDTGFVRIFNFSLSGTSAKFSQNITLDAAVGDVINFTARVNDTSNNFYTNDTIVTITNTAPSGLSVIQPTPNQYTSLQPFGLNVTFAEDPDGDTTTINYYINGKLNDSTAFNTTFNASDGHYILNVSISDGIDEHANITVNFTLDTVDPIINATLNQSLASIDNNDIINLTANATDETGLSFGQIIVNDTGFVRIFNFSLNDATSATFSQNITLSPAGVFNFTARVNDSSNSFTINDTIITVSDTRVPTVNATFNKSISLIGIFELVNLTAGATDETGLSFGQIIVNDTGFTRYFNFSLSGTSSEFSQNVTLNAEIGDVINFTARVNDTSNNFKTNDTVITVVDAILPIVNSSINKTLTNITFNEVINITANVTDETGLSFGQIIVNNTGIVRIFNFSLSGTSSEFFQNITLNAEIGDVINFTARVNDTNNNFKTNDTIVTIVNLAPTIDSIKLNATSPDNLTSDNLTGHITSSDYEGHNITLVYNWYKNGILNATNVFINHVNLTGYWPLNNDTLDYKKSNDGTLNGNALINSSGGQILGGLEVDGSGDFVALQTTTGLTSSFTISVWANNLVGGTLDRIFMDGRGGVNGWGVGFGNAVGEFRFTKSGVVDLDIDVGNFPTGWFHSVWVVKSDNDVELFIDGDSKGEYGNTAAITANSNNEIAIGTDYDSSGNTLTQWDGKIDELMIFNRSLTASEISQLYHGSAYGGRIMNSSQTNVGETWIFGAIGVDYLNIGDEINSSGLLFSETLPPTVNMTLNQSLGSIRTNDVINITANATDNAALSSGQIIVNDTGFTRYFNFSLSGTSAKFSQNITLSGVNGDVINFTVRVNDTSGNEDYNFTIANITPVSRIELSLIAPTGDINVTQNQSFAVTVNLSCIDSNCGEINATLDPASTPASCKEVYDNGDTTSGIYTIYPYSNGTGYNIYCDQETDDGGWTLVASIYQNTLDDKNISYHGNLTTLSPLQTTSQGIWGGLRGLVTSTNINDTGDDIRFACKGDRTDSAFDVDLAFYDIGWYYKITNSTNDANVCFEQSNGAGDTQPPPARKDILADTSLDKGNQYNANSYLEGEDACSSTDDFTVDFDDRGMDSNQNDGTDWGEDDSSKKCGSSTTSTGAWFIFFREDVNYSSSKSGTVSTVENATPFYTNVTNPYNTTLNAGENAIITWWVNATGDTNTTHEFFVYANETSDMSISNFTIKWNVTIQAVDSTFPTINTALNKSFTNIKQKDVINLTANATDNVKLSLGQIIVNDTGFTRYFNFSLSGTTGTFSQNITIAQSDLVINFTARVNDSSNNFAANDTLVTVLPVMNLTINLNDTSVLPNTNDLIYVNGHINLSNGTNVSNTKISIWINGTPANVSSSLLKFNASIIETYSTDWNSGTAINVTINANNITLIKNTTSPFYPNQTGNFTSKIIDTETLNANFTFISWTTEVPYQTEIERAVGDSNTATDEDGFMNTSGLIVLFHFNNESAFGENATGGDGDLVYDFSADANSDRGISARNNGTTYNGATINKTNYKFGGGALELDGSNDYLDAGSENSLNGDSKEISISAWIKLNALGIDQKIAGNQNNINGGYKIGLFTNNKVELEIRSSSNTPTLNRNVAGGTAMVTGRWYHVVGVYSNSEDYIKTYVDGSLDRELSTTAVLGSSPGSMILGKEPWTGSLYLDGQIDEFSIWNRSLSAKEILDLYKRGVLSLNLSVRSCDDANCSGETWSNEFTNSSGIQLNETITPTNRFFQYKAISHTNNNNLTPALNDVTINYTTLGTDSNGNYNYTYNSPSGLGTYPIKVNTTFNEIYGENSFNLNVNTPPNISTINFPTSDLYTNSQPLDLNITARDDDNDVLNISFYIDGKLNQTSLTNTTFNASDGYYILNVSVSDNIEISANVTVNFTLDTINPNITLILPLNNTGDRDRNITFIYNVTDTNNINNCSLHINNVLNISNASITRNIAQNFTLTNVGVKGYNWSISCTDVASNIGSSSFRKVVVVQHRRFNGTTIDIETVDVRNVTNLTLENSVAGKINFTTGIDLSGGADINKYVNITANRIEINSTAIPALNKSAILYLYNLTFTNPRILRDSSLCSSDICTKISYTDNTLKFNVTRFSVYSAEETPVSAGDLSSGTGGGGGGGSPGGAGGGIIKKDFSIDTNIIKEKVLQGETKTAELQIKNTGGATLQFSVEIEGIGKFVAIGDDSFGLEPGETKIIIVSFTASETEFPDAYSGKLIIKAGGIKKSIISIIEVIAKKALFDINILVDENYKKVLRSQEVKFNIDLINLGTLKPVDVELYYAIKDLDENIITFKTETRAVSDELSVERSLEIPEDIRFGSYIVYSRVTYNEQIAASSDLFEVVEILPKIEESTEFILLKTISMMLLSIIIILSAYIIYPFLVKRKKLKIKNKLFDNKIKDKIPVVLEKINFEARNFNESVCNKATFTKKERGWVVSLPGSEYTKSIPAKFIGRYSFVNKEIIGKANELIYDETKRSRGIQTIEKTPQVILKKTKDTVDLHQKEMVMQKDKNKMPLQQENKEIVKLDETLSSMVLNSEKNDIEKARKKDY